MLRKLFVLFLIALVVAGGIGGYLLFTKISTPVSKAIIAIPSDAAIIIESDDFPNAWNDLKSVSVFWNKLKGMKLIDQIDNRTAYLDSLFSKQGEIAQLVKGQATFISIHLTGIHNYDYLFLVSLKNTNRMQDFNQIIKSLVGDNTINKRSYDKVDIFEISTEVGIFNYSISKGIFLGSFSPLLIEDAIRQMNSSSSLINKPENKGFELVHSTAGTDAACHFYINYSRFPKFASLFLRSKKHDLIGELSNFANWTELDLKIKSNSLMWNGLTFSNDSLPRFLNLLADQEPQDMEMIQVLPDNTAVLHYFGIEDFNKYYNDYKSYLGMINELYDYTQIIEKTEEKYGMNIYKDLLSLFSNEFAQSTSANVNSPDPKSNKTKDYAIFGLKDSEDALEILQDLCKVIQNNIEPPDSEKVNPSEVYRDHEILHLGIPNMLNNLFGHVFSQVKSNYCTVVGDYVVFAETANHLKNFIADNLSGRTMNRDISYLAFSDHISSSANYFLYYNIPLCLKTGMLQALFEEEWAITIVENIESIQEFQALGLQISSGSMKSSSAGGRMYYTNIYLEYNPDYKEKTQLFRQTKLDAPLRFTPWVVKNHYTDDNEIFIQDELNQVYLVDKSNNILWKKTISEPIIGDVTQIDIYKSNKLQLLFNTKTKLHLIDRKGRDVEDFPIELKSPATNGISVFDYDNTRNYRIIICGEDKEIYVYDSYGKIVTGWEFDKTSSLVYAPISHISVNGKDHIVAVDVKGMVYSMDRRGNQRMKPFQAFNYLFDNTYYLDKGNSIGNSWLISSDSAGIVRLASFSGKTDSLVFDDFTNPPYFKYARRNGKKQYIFLNRDELMVFGEDKEIVYNKSFDRIIAHRPLVYNLPDNDLKIGVVSEKSDELYLFNPDGSLSEGFPLYGNSNFVLMHNSGKTSLVAGARGNYLFIYSLQ